jgi:hypothetical protein
MIAVICNYIVIFFAAVMKIYISIELNLLSRIKRAYSNLPNIRPSTNALKNSSSIAIVPNSRFSWNNPEIT